MNGFSNKVDCIRLAEIVMEQHLKKHELTHYAGIVSLHGLVRLAEISGSEKLRKWSIDLLRPFFSGEIKSVRGVYSKMYSCGGNAAAWLAEAGYAPEILPMLVAYADELMATHPRDKHGIFGTLKDPEKIWIDTAFAVCPFLTYIGNLTGEKKYLDEACRQMLGMDELLRNKQTGLYHQSLNFAGTGKLSDDHWSRGNGWAALALCEIVAELPSSHPEYAGLKKIYIDFMETAILYQDADGMWHQEMTEKESYVETSGCGLILFAIGRGIEKGLLSAKFMDSFQKGLKGYCTYIALDGAVFNTCVGCLCPGDGSKAAYMAHRHQLNDQHSFGPVILAFGQAAKLGIKSVELA